MATRKRPTNKYHARRKAKKRRLMKNRKAVRMQKK